MWYLHPLARAFASGIYYYALMAEKKQSHEWEAFNNQLAHLKDCINPSDLAAKCYSEKIIGSEEFEEIEDERSRPRKATILLRVVGRSIKSDPANFYTFLRVLESEPTNKKLVENLGTHLSCKIHEYFLPPFRSCIQAPCMHVSSMNNIIFHI